MAKLLGMGGSVGSTPVTEWSITINNDSQDVTDTGSAGWQAMLAGVNSAETSFTAFWGAGAGSLAAAYPIGTVVALTLNVGISGAAFSGNFLIKSISVKNNAKSPVEFSCTGTSTGAVTVPS